MIIREILRNPLLQDSRVVFTLPLSITSHLYLMQMVSIGMTTLFYTGTGPSSGKGFAHYGESLAAHSFLQRVQCFAHEFEGQLIYLTILFMHKSQQMFLVLYGLFVVSTL